MGLDNAGKTSILTAMKKRFDIPKEIKGLKPTLKVERSNFQFMDHLIYQNDFGGQRDYREEYLKHKDRYLAGTDLLYYVVDIQDSMRFDDCIKYFNEIVAYYKEIDKIIPIVVFFHKIDPKLKEDPTIIKNAETLKSAIRKWKNDFKIKTFQTNIFEINTVVQAFSHGISMLYTQNEVIQKFLLDLVEKMENVMALLMFEQSGIELGTYFLENITLNMRKKILTLYEIAQRRIVENNANTYEFSDRLDAFTKVSGVIQSFEVEGLKFFILVILEEHSEEVIIDQFNFIENSYSQMNEILQTILLEDDERTKALNPE